MLIEAKQPLLEISNRRKESEQYQPQADLENFRLNFSRSLRGAEGFSAHDHAPLNITLTKEKNTAQLVHVPSLIEK